MTRGMKRRDFLGATTLGSVCLGSVMRSVDVGAVQAALPVRPGRTKTKVGKVYMGTPYPGWPSHVFDLEAEIKRFEAEFAKLAPVFEDVEFVEGGLYGAGQKPEAVVEKFKDVDGVLVVQLSMGASLILRKLAELDIPIVHFALPFAGHEWMMTPQLQKQGRRVEVIGSSDFNDLAVAIRPFRAIHRLKEAKVLLAGARLDAKYAESIKEKFGTEIVTLPYEELRAAYDAVEEAEAEEVADWWIRNAMKVVEPTMEERLKSARMELALVKIADEEQADAIAMNCLGWGLVQKGMAYPCLAFSRLSSEGRGGICEADLKSCMTHVICQAMTGKPGFVTDPLFDLSRNCILHAHCVAPIKMDGPNGEQCKYNIRSHLEDNASVSLDVKFRVGQDITMARLIGTENMLFSTGKIIEIPDEPRRGCRTKCVVQVKNAQRLLDNWSCGLHRILFYGDYGDDLRRFCHFKDIRMVYEEEEDCRDIPGLDWRVGIFA